MGYAAGRVASGETAMRADGDLRASAASGLRTAEVSNASLRTAAKRRYYEMSWIVACET